MFYHDTGSENGNDVFPNITQRCERQQSCRGVVATMVTGGNIDIYYNQNIITLSTAQYNLVIMTLFINTPPPLYIWTRGGRFRMCPRYNIQHEIVGDKWRRRQLINVRTSAANRLIGEVVQSRRRPLLGPSPGYG